jgi:phytanoyl-CoA hydroxylase
MIPDGLFKSYLRDGFALAPSLLSDEETARLRKLTADLEASADPHGGDTPVFDFSEPGPDGVRPIQRIKKPHRVDPFYAELARHRGILSFIEKAVGPAIRLNHSKINMKSAYGGDALEWHQDWAFAPHTNMSTCVASVFIDDAGPDNGALQVIEGSHKGPLIDHHDNEGFFSGVIPIHHPDMDLTKARMLTAPAGSVGFHHPLTIHGSSVNRSGQSRRILFLEYAATDAYPLFYPVDWAEYESRIVQGPSTSQVRIETNPVKLPFPSKAGSSIYNIQAAAKSRYFATAV